MLHWDGSCIANLELDIQLQHQQYSLLLQAMCTVHDRGNGITVGIG